ncbi:MAG: protein-L-isoaspartate O-methyltransferase [Burkholderiales bacterium]|jgi:protein-L-isoaspartate(D-aspartate) O-methyltransferase
MNFDQARFNMIESQIRTWDVLDQAVLDAVAAVKREDFVPEQYRELAFADMEIPLRPNPSDPSEIMLSPKLEARMLQELALTPQDRVLEIGTGSGYVTALMARLVKHVFSVEIVPEFTELAQGRLQSASVTNVTLEAGDGGRGWEQAAPYDAILLTASVPVLPDAFKAQLNPGGRLLAVIGDEPAMTATLVTRISESDYSSGGLFETCLPPLRNVIRPSRFDF